MTNVGGKIANAGLGCITALGAAAVITMGTLGFDACFNAGHASKAPPNPTQTPSAPQQTWTDVNNPELIKKTKDAQMFWGVATGATLLLLMGGLAALDTIKKR